MTKRDWRIIAATLVTAWSFYCLLVAGLSSGQVQGDPLWIQLTAAYPFVIALLASGILALANLWKWAVRE